MLFWWGEDFVVLEVGGLKNIYGNNYKLIYVNFYYMCKFVSYKFVCF